MQRFCLQRRQAAFILIALTFSTSWLVFYFQIISNYKLLLLFLGPLSSAPTYQDLDISKTLDLPLDYSNTPSNQWCEDRYGVSFLTNTRDRFTNYCQGESTSRLSCFWSTTADGQDRIDGMCYGEHATYDAQHKAFQLDCPLRNLSAGEVKSGLPSLPDGFNEYWYETGASEIVGKSLLLNGTTTPQQTQRVTVLVKREGSGNLWHSLLEIMSLSWAFDVLQITTNNYTAKPYLTRDQQNDTQIVLVDEHSNGPYFDLWRLFGKMPVRRLKDLSPEEPLSNVVIPFAGASNTLWQGDWVDLPCKQSSLLTTFVHRVLNLYNIETIERKGNVSVTFVHRNGPRRLLNQTEHIEALKKAMPYTKVNVVDFASIPLKSQIEIVRNTDVLVGVHGAGLTHTLFLQPGSAVVEIIPEHFEHKGFRNLAQMLGHGYFRTHAERASDTPENDDTWQMEPVQIDRERFVEVVRAGVRTMYSKGSRTIDVS